MKLAFAVLGALIVATPVSIVTSQATEEHKVVMPQEVKWGPASAALPAGAQVAVLLGDPSWMRSRSASMPPIRKNRNAVDP